MEIVNAFFNSVVLYIIFGAVALGGAILGIALRKGKIQKKAKKTDRRYHT